MQASLDLTVLMSSLNSTFPDPRFSYHRLRSSPTAHNTVPVSMASSTSAEARRRDRRTTILGDEEVEGDELAGMRDVEGKGDRTLVSGDRRGVEEKYPDRSTLSFGSAVNVGVMALPNALDG